MSLSPALLFYRGATSLVGAFAGAYLFERAREGKEDPERVQERFGRYAGERPEGALVWFHAASVGESGVALALVEALAARDPTLSFLISTGTRTSAELVARRAAPRTAHVYAPLDRVDAVRRFLDHWRPDLGVFVESELWPNLVLEAEARAVPLALVNARISPKSLARWLRWRSAGEKLARAFRVVSAADQRTADALSELRGAPVANAGNLKLATPPPRVDTAQREALAADIGARPLWLAASTHPGEDEIALAAHNRLRAEFPNALLIIVPRHPERGEAIAALAGGAPRRSQHAGVGAGPVYVADTLGELGLFYALAPAALVAGSLLPHLKGHNPVEPAKLDCAIVSGPNVESFQDVFDALFSAEAATRVETAEQLATAIATLWRDDAARLLQIDAARAIANRGADAFADTVAQPAALAPSTARAANASA